MFVQYLGTWVLYSSIYSFNLFYKLNFFRYRHTYLGGNHRGYNIQDTETLEVARHLQRQHTWTGKTLGVSDIMAVALIAGGAIAGVTLLTTFFLEKTMVELILVKKHWLIQQLDMKRRRAYHHHYFLLWILRYCINHYSNMWNNSIPTSTWVLQLFQIWL